MHAMLRSDPNILGWDGKQEHFLPAAEIAASMLVSEMEGAVLNSLAHVTETWVNKHLDSLAERLAVCVGVEKVW